MSAIQTHRAQPALVTECAHSLRISCTWIPLISSHCFVGSCLNCAGGEAPKTAALCFSIQGQEVHSMGISLPRCFLPIQPCALSAWHGYMNELGLLCRRLGASASLMPNFKGCTMACPPCQLQPLGQGLVIGTAAEKWRCKLLPRDERTTLESYNPSGICDKKTRKIRGPVFSF